MKIGDRFGRLVVIGLVPDNKNPKAKCICDCGTVVTPQRGAMVNGRAKSCGCLRRELLLKAATTHGLSKTTLYGSWASMHQRCENPKDPAYHNYGGRGITVDPEWKDFEKFLRDMGDRPKAATIERKDTNGPYSKDNCVWGTWAEQGINKRVSKRWTIHGTEYESSVAAAKDLGVSPSVIIRRTNGFKRGTKEYPPVDGYSSRLFYE